MKKIFLTMAMVSSMLFYAQQSSIIRKDLSTLILKQNIQKIESQEITFPPGQSAPQHIHPCPVVGYIKAGTVLYQIEGQEPQILKEGDAFLEPKDAKILHFDNYSQTEPMTFVAFYLKEGNEENTKLVKP